MIRRGQCCPGSQPRWGGWAGVALAGWLAVTVANIGSSSDLQDAYRNGRYCFAFLLSAGLPMIVLVVAALRSTRSLNPTRSLVTAGFSVAFLTFGLLAFCHPATTTGADTAGHLAAAFVLGLLTVLFGSKPVAA